MSGEGQSRQWKTGGQSNIGQMSGQWGAVPLGSNGAPAPLATRQLFPIGRKSGDLREAQEIQECINPNPFFTSKVIALHQGRAERELTWPAADRSDPQAAVQKLGCRNVYKFFIGR